MPSLPVRGAGPGLSGNFPKACHPDSGIRLGQDVLRAHALGARGVYIGQPFLYGLGALGGKGMAACLALMRKEFHLTMAFCGVSDLGQVNSAILRRSALEARGRWRSAGQGQQAGNKEASPRHAPDDGADEFECSA